MHSSSTATVAWSTIILVKNIHCASCVSYVQRILDRFENGIYQVDINTVSHHVRVLHSKSLSASEICQSLSDAAFEVYSAITLDEGERKVQELGVEDTGDGWLEAAAGIWKPSLNLTKGNEDLRRRSHLMNCVSCQKESNQHLDMSANSTTTSLGSPQEEDPVLVDNGFVNARNRGMSQLSPNTSLSTNLPLSPTAQHPGSNERFEAILSISGMTCASCTSAIDRGLSSKELPFVESVNVTLMTNSAKVVFTGEDNLQKIIDTVEDLGYEAHKEHCHMINAQSNEGHNKIEESQRTVMLKIDGMFCKHCPLRILEAIKMHYSDVVTIDKPPTLKDPIVGVSYSPSPPGTTIRQIITVISSLEQSFNANIYSPPSLEQRSQDMQKQEQRRLLMRLLLSSGAAIPTLLIGVVWMSLVPESNLNKQYFEKAIWAGAVTRADWALFILATPVFFFAADVFHTRALKVCIFE